MAEISASMVKELRERTDAPMMDCKKALNEAEGDMAKAEEILRVKFGNKASKAAGRIAAEGVVGIQIDADGKRGAMIEVNCETDFVAKNDDFLAFARDLAGLVVEQQSGGRGGPVRADAQWKGGRTDSHRAGGPDWRKHEPAPFCAYRGQGQAGSYVHGGAKIGVLVDVSGGDEQLGKDLAMHIAATKPVSLSRDNVPAELIEKERSVASQKAAESGKPADIVAKMVEGAVAKYLEGSHPAGPVFRQGRQADHRATAQGQGRDGQQLCPLHCGRGDREEEG